MVVRLSGRVGPSRVLFPDLAGENPSRQVKNEVKELRVEVSGLSQSVVSRLDELQAHQPLFEQLLGAINHALKQPCPRAVADSPRAC